MGTARTDSPHTDLLRGNWVDRRVPARVRPYVRLARLDRPIGIWLLLLPCWWGLALAGSHDGWLYLLFGLGAVLMRGAGCTLNDLLDRDIDANVERTRGRPLPAGEITPRQALVFLAAQALAGLVVLLQLNPTAIWLGCLSLVPVVVYPLMKRVMGWPQAVLGLAFNWGALLGWTAITGTVGGPSLPLYAAGFAWTIVYDTIYAHQDQRDDAIIGVRSTARTFGRYSRPVLAGFAVAMLALLAVAFRAAGLGPAGWLGLTAVALHLAWLLAFWRTGDPADCLARFKTSRWTGWLVLAAIVAGGLSR